MVILGDFGKIIKNFLCLIEILRIGVTASLVPGNSFVLKDVSSIQTIILVGNFLAGWHFQFLVFLG